MIVTPPSPAPEDLVIDEALVADLVARQFPSWAHLPLSRVPSAGTDNAMFRLGADLVVRLPRAAAAAHQVDKEQRWLPVVSADLPLDVPTPLGVGTPSEPFPLPWSVYRWLEGEDAFVAPPVDLREAAGSLGRFVSALRLADPTGGPPSFRGGPVRTRDDYVQDAIGDLGADGTVDPHETRDAWEAVLALPQWDGPSVWLHGDLLPGNLLTVEGRLSAVIDFGGMGVGDPACDLMPAWTMFTPETRSAFADAVGSDADTWARGRGWALCFGLMSEHYYRHSNPVLAGIGRRAVLEALDDLAAGT